MNMKELERALGPVKRRMRLQRTFVWCMYGLFAAAVCVVLLRAASFLWIFPTAFLWSVAALIALPSLFALVSWLWPITSMDAARQADALGLMARAQTAVMLGGCETDMARLQRRDALNSLKTLQPARQMALRPPRLAWMGTLACAVLVGISFLIPNPQTERMEQQAIFHAEMMEQAQKVDEGATALDTDAAETPELRRLLGELSVELRHAQSVRDALTAVDTTERKVESLTARTARDALDAMRAAGLDALAQALEDGDQQAARAALEAARDGEAGQAALADAAAKASDGTAVQQLEAAAQAMASGSADEALSALASAASGQTAASAQTLALTGMVRGAAARTGAQGTADTQSSAGMTLARGAGQGAGERQGAGMTGGGAGLGSSDKDGGTGAAGAQAPATQGAAAPEKKTAEYEAIYDPTRLGGSGETHSERGQMGEGEVLEAEAGTGAGSLEGSVPYRQALPEYREAAVDAAQDGNLPAYARRWVEAYFDALAQ